MFDFHFDIEDSIVPTLGPPRLTPEFFHLGKHDQDIEFADIAIRVARTPIAVNLRQYYKESQEQLPQFKSIYQYANVILLTHCVHIMDRGWIDRVLHFGLKVKFEADDLIIDLFPQTKFQHAAPNNRTAEAGLTPGGRFHPWPGQAEHGSGNGMERIAYDIVSPEIVAVGEGDYQGEWIFRKAQRSLAGSHKMSQTLMVPEVKDVLAFEVQVYATFEADNLLPNRRESEWIGLQCRIPE